MDTPQHTLAPIAPAASSRVWRWARRLGIAVASGYLLGGLALYYLQRLIVFPASTTQGQATVVPAAGRGEYLVQLRTPDGPSVVALYGEALGADGSRRDDARACPTVLYFYGNGENVDRSLDVVQVLRRMGANVLVPDYLGYGMSGGEPSDAGVYQTAEAAYQYLVNDAAVDPGRLIVLGRSLGGAAAIDVASRHPVGGLIMVSAFTTLSEACQDAVPIYPAGLLCRYRMDNIGRMVRVRCAVLLIHGTSDNLIAFDMSRRLQAAATAARSVSLYSVDGAGHNDILYVGGQTLLERIDRFVTEVAATQRR